MRLYYETVAPELKDALVKLMNLPSLNSFRLVGDTNLALQLGHRISIDLDLFSDEDYFTTDYTAISKELSETFPYFEGKESLKECNVGHYLYIGENKEKAVKLDFWHVDPYVFPMVKIDNIRMADIKEIAAFKLSAATTHYRRQKDFWDINELLRHFSLKQMIEFAELRYPYNFNREDLIKSLMTLDNVELAPEGIQCLRVNYWELIIEDLKKEAQKLQSN